MLQPSVLLEPNHDARISTQEVFGTVVAVYRYVDHDDAITEASALKFAFQARVFAQDIDVAMSPANRLVGSAVIINNATAFRRDWVPFAGRGQSGYGTGGILYTMRDLTQDKLILLRKSWPTLQGNSQTAPGFFPEAPKAYLLTEGFPDFASATLCNIGLLNSQHNCVQHQPTLNASENLCENPVEMRCGIRRSA